MKKKTDKKSQLKPLTRRKFLKGTAAGAATLAIPVGTSDASVWQSFFQKHFREMSKDEMAAVIKRMEKEYADKYKTSFNIKTTGALPDTLYGYGLDLSRCNGNRLCVHACVEENNQSRAVPGAPHQNPIEWIRVLQMDKDRGIDLDYSDPYYEGDTVPSEGKFYFPVQCQQCENPPCVKVCPVKATWKEDDGIVVIDYDWCIGCRCCMSACPYDARHFNWCEPNLPADQLNPKTHVLGNRPRPRGVVEKCTFCIQRTRKGLYPACHEACPTGARVFGNLLDPASEIRQLMERKRVFVFKSELNTRPSFFYFYG